jgi:hypothetical protein
MKVAVCLSGAIKYPEKSLESIKKIYPNDFLKVFIHTWEIENKKEYGRDSFSGKMGLYAEMDILNEYQYEDILIENYNIKREEFQNIFDTLQFKESHRKDVGIISMYYSIFKSNELKVLYETRNNFIFDRVIRMRFDSDFKDKDLILDENVNGIQIPNGSDYAGINDQFAIGNSEDMNLYCNLFNKLETLKDMEYNPERLLSIYFDRIQIKSKVQRFDFEVKINNG